MKKYLFKQKGIFFIKLNSSFIYNTIHLHFIEELK